jgi:hypothetical protein
MVQGGLGPPCKIYGCSDDDFPVTIGITVGLFGSNLAIATFISVTRKLKGTPPRKAQVGSAF